MKLEGNAIQNLKINFYYVASGQYLWLHQSHEYQHFVSQS